MANTASSWGLRDNTLSDYNDVRNLIHLFDHCKSYQEFVELSCSCLNIADLFNHLRLEKGFSA